MFILALKDNEDSDAYSEYINYITEMIKEIMFTSEITHMKENLIQLSTQLADSEHHLETIFN